MIGYPKPTIVHMAEAGGVRSTGHWARKYGLDIWLIVATRVYDRSIAPSPGPNLILVEMILLHQSATESAT